LITIISPSLNSVSILSPFTLRAKARPGKIISDPYWTCWSMVRYYCWYSNKSRGLRKKQGNLTPDDQPLDEAVEIIDVSEYQTRRIPSKQWRSPR
jgi:hypothetical protein